METTCIDGFSLSENGTEVALTCLVLIGEIIYIAEKDALHIINGKRLCLVKGQQVSIRPNTEPTII